MMVLAFLSPLGRYLPSGRCTPSRREFSQAGLATSEPVACTPFYLDESTPGLHVPDLERCFEKYSGLAKGSVRTDDRVEPFWAQHISDFHLLRQLRCHPSRVYDPHEAVVHFTGLLPTISHIYDHDAAWKTNDEGCRNVPKHFGAMRVAAQALEAKLNELPPGDPRV